MSLRTCLLSGACFALLSTPAHAAPVWVGDLETGDFSQFNNVLNGTVNDQDYATIVGDTIVQGDSAARLELHNDAEWSNGLRRVELQHRPEDARTAEGATTFFAWSFYLPEALPDDPGHTLGYWESANSFQQMMAFNTNGQDVRFITQQPYTEHWAAEGVITPGEWHRIAMRVLWSTDAGTGEVDVWFDGEQVVEGVVARTLADGNPHFTQIGLLRGDTDIDTVPVVYIDNALEGDSLEDVNPVDPSGGTGSTGGSDDGPGDTAMDVGETAGDELPMDSDEGADDSTSGVSAGPGGGVADQGDDGNGTDGIDSTSGTGSSADDDASGCSCTTGHDRRDSWFMVVWLAVACGAATRAASRRSPRAARRPHPYR